jgi:hypothetical protein
LSSSTNITRIITTKGLRRMGVEDVRRIREIHTECWWQTCGKETTRIIYGHVIIILKWILKEQNGKVWTGLT